MGLAAVLTACGGSAAQGAASQGGAVQETAAQDATEQGTASSETAGQDASEPGTAASETAEQGATETGTAASETAEPETSAPEFHAIAFDPALDTLEDADGADAYDHALDHADSRYFVIHDFYNMKSEGDLHIISQFETYQQTTEHTCGCASALMVMEHFGDRDYNEMEIGEIVEVDSTTGTSVEGLVKLFEEAGYRTEYHADTDYYFESIDEAEAYLLEKIDAGIPVMVDWVDWQGHWQVVIGMDGCGTDDPYDDVLILADPYDITDHYQDGYYVFPFGRFFDMWREGVCAGKEVPYEQPFVTAWKE